MKTSRQSGSLAQPPREEGITYTKHKYSDEIEQEIVARDLAGESTVVLGRAYGSPRRTINSILARHGVERRKADSFPLRSNARLYGTDPNELRAMVERGMSIREIGRTSGTCSSGVHSACKRLGIPLRSQKEGAAQGRTHIPDSLFASPLNANESWLPGLLLTDGCVHKNIVKLSITDEDAVHLAFQVIGFGNIVKRLPHGLKTYSGLKIEGKLPVWTYTACSIELVERLENWGLVPRKTKTLAFPDPTAMSLADFIRGLWDGDGCWYIQSKRTGALGSHFGSASEQFMRALHLIIARITGSAATVRANKRGDFWQLQYAGAGAVALARWLYASPNPMCLARKLAIVKQTITVN